MFKKIKINDLGRPPSTDKSIRLVDDKSYTGGGKNKKQKKKSQSKDEIRKKLQGYIECDIANIPLYSHCRYITWDKDNKRPKFCQGGMLTLKRDKYIVLTNGRLRWTVSREFVDKEGNVYFRSRVFKKRDKTDNMQKELEKRDKLVQKLYKLLKGK
tara:strand:+ start:873 stop:1340 length:468 start_codon:yes stop_codon:yes gene_type:complete